MSYDDENRVPSNRIPVKWPARVVDTTHSLTMPAVSIKRMETVTHTKGHLVPTTPASATLSLCRSQNAKGRTRIRTRMNSLNKHAIVELRHNPTGLPTRKSREATVKSGATLSVLRA